MLLTALAALGSIGSAIFGAASSAAANNRARTTLKDQYENTDRVLRSELRKDYTSRTDFQNILNRLQEVGDQYTKRERGINAVVGGNEAGVYAQKKANALREAQVMSNEAARAASYKDSVRNKMLANDQAYAQQLANIDMRQGQTIANAAGQVTKAMSGIAGADNATFGDDLNMFGLDMSQYELHDDGHWYRIPKGR